MDTPRDFLPVYVQFDVRRYLSYRWKPSLVRDVIYRRHGYRLLHACIKAIGNDTPCPKRCRENCLLCREGRPKRKLVTPEELHPEPKKKQEKFSYDEYLFYY